VLKKPASLDWILCQELTPRHKLLLSLALQAAATITQEQLNVDLTEVCSLHNQLCSKKKHGLVLTARLTDEDRVCLCTIIEDPPKGYLAHDGSFDLIFNAGCAKPATGFKQDFVAGALKDPPEPTHVSGIAGGLDIRQEGRVRCEVIDNKGDIQVIDAAAHFIPDLPCQLFSPQACMCELFASGKDPKEVSEMSLKHNWFKFTWPNGAQVSVQCCCATFPPKLCVHTAMHWRP